MADESDDESETLQQVPTYKNSALNSQQLENPPGLAAKDPALQSQLAANKKPVSGQVAVKKTQPIDREKLTIDARDLLAARAAISNEFVDALLNYSVEANTTHDDRAVNIIEKVVKDTYFYVAHLLANPQPKLEPAPKKRSLKNRSAPSTNSAKISNGAKLFLKKNKLFDEEYNANNYEAISPNDNVNRLKNLVTKNFDKYYETYKEQEEELFNINGIFIKNEFITSNEEINLIDEMNKSDWIDSQSGRFKQDYGPKVNFKKKKLKLNEFKGLPMYSKLLIDRFKTGLKQLESFEPVELCNLRYECERSACIEAHKDDCWLWGNRLITINLLLSSFWLSLPYAIDFCHQQCP
jgi:hypothetical protein